MVTYKLGKELLIADTLSRAYLPDEDANIQDEELEINLVNTLPISENKLELIKYQTLQDPSLQQLKQIVLTMDREKVQLPTHHHSILELSS